MSDIIGIKHWEFNNISVKEPIMFWGGVSFSLLWSYLT